VSGPLPPSAGDPLQSLTGDLGAARALRRSLVALAEAHAGEPLGFRLREVVDGQRDVRSLADDPAFADLAESGMAAYERWWAELGPEERAEQVRAGEAYLDTLEDPRLGT
jgi:hypothetical protein